MRIASAPAAVNFDDRELLIRLGRGPCSGPQLAALLGLSRAAVWKRVEALRRAGAPIIAVPGRGYTLEHPIELLDADLIRGALLPGARAQADALEVVWQVDSTNAELLRRALPLTTQILFAERQTHGRGRRGRSWITPLGGQLACSVQRRFDGGVAAMAGLSLAVGVVVAEGLRAAGFAGIVLKWPNDLVCDGRKLGGILIEFGGEFAGPLRAVIGIGINTALPDAAAGSIDQPWTDLRRLDPERAVARNALAACLLDALLPALDCFAQDGLAAFLPRWEKLDALRGSDIHVLVDGRHERGIALGISVTGALRVRHADRECLHHSAEVSVRPARAESA